MGTPAQQIPSSPRLTLGPLRAPLIFGGAAVAVVAFGIAWFMASDVRSFMSSYLVAFCFCITISLGGLFWVTVMHLTRAGWGVSVRRLAEIMAMATFPLLFAFLPVFIPVMLGHENAIYDWVHLKNLPARLQGFDDLLAHKEPFLNGPFFAVRTLVYFAIWGACAFYFLRSSRKQDETKDKATSLQMQAFAAPAMLLFAGTIVFASFDWGMSLEPIFFSTIFPVYWFAGAAMSSICTLTLLSFFLQRSGRLTNDITTDNYHDLGKLTFGFVFFWGYIAFSQYLLIWYANLPEETFWFRYRQEGGWETASLILMGIHLFLPFLAVMPRTLRRNKFYMAGASIFLLGAHWFDHFWLVMPTTFRPEFGVTAVDGLCLLGMVGVYIMSLALIAGDRNLIPAGDPRLYESLSYHNA